jgi:hypothetical protein
MSLGPHDKSDLPGASRGFLLLAILAHPSPVLDPFHAPKGSSPAHAPPNKMFCRGASEAGRRTCAARVAVSIVLMSLVVSAQRMSGVSFCGRRKQGLP